MRTTYALREADSGTPVAYLHWLLGVREANFYNWSKKYGKFDLTELR